jgi:hypothetical protein
MFTCVNWGPAWASSTASSAQTGGPIASASSERGVTRKLSNLQHHGTKNVVRKRRSMDKSHYCQDWDFTQDPYSGKLVATYFQSFFIQCLLYIELAGYAIYIF